MRKTYQLTQIDIDNGASADCHFCPVALLIKRVFPKTIEVEVTYGEIKIELINTKIITLKVGKALGSWLRRFDNVFEPVKSRPRLITIDTNAGTII